MIQFINRSTMRAILAAGLAGILGACGPAANNTNDGGNNGSEAGVRPGTTAAANCLERCMANASLAAMKVCGSDRQTYSACDWMCARVPMGLTTVPGACGVDGAPPADGPPYPADGQSVCDWIKQGSEWVAIECGDDLVNMITESGTSEMPVGESPVTNPMALPASVNHRSRFGVAENQGSVGACTAFATTAGLESAISARGLRVDLSEMHLWLRYCRPSQNDALTAARAGITSKMRADMLMHSYDGASAMGRARACYDARMADMAALMTLDTEAQFTVTSVDELTPPMGETRPTPAQIQRALADGSDVVVAMALVGAEWSTAPMGVVPDSDVTPTGGHAVLIVGYERRGETLYFQFRNSWGADWGDSGYGYVSEAYLRTHLYRPAFTIQAACESCLNTIPDCPAGQAASGVDGMCRMVCPGGLLADAMGMCPPPAMCDDGYVNDANGTCVPACRMGMVTYMSGITSNCTPQGCQVAIPMGVNGCMNAGGCDLNCPAPLCAVGRANNEFGNPRTVCMRPQS